MFYIIYGLVLLPVLILLPTKIIGKQNIIKKGRMILCCNHQSNWDIILVAIHLKRKYKFLAKEELFKNKIKGSFLKNLGGYPIKRGETDIGAVKQTLKFLQSNKAICIFPEGKRLESNEKNQLKNGVVMFALKSDSPIVPAYILNKPRLFSRNKIIIGKAFKFSEFEEFKDKKISKELLNLGADILSKKIYELKQKEK